MTNDAINSNESVKQKYFLVSKRGTAFFILLILLAYVFMVFKAGWDNQWIYSTSPYKWDEKRKEICARNLGIKGIDENKVEFDLGVLVFRPVHGYAPASLFDTNPECEGYKLRSGLYGGKAGSFRTIYVNKSNETVAEITVLYTDKKGE